MLHSDLGEAFPGGEFAHFFNAGWLTQMARDTRANKDNNQRTQDTARWAREQIKRQGMLRKLYYVESQGLAGWS